MPFYGRWTIFVCNTSYTTETNSIGTKVQIQSEANNFDPVQQDHDVQGSYRQEW